MTEQSDLLAKQFEANRPHLRAVAYRMLGSLTEADDAVQEAWIRLDRSDAGEIDNLAGWLTTVTARIALDMLRSRSTRREEPMEWHVPDPIVSADKGVDPEQEALTADSVGLALLVVLDTLAPAERLAFVLHDMFAVPFEEIAPIVERTPVATRQLASRARRRVQGAAPGPDTSVVRQREVVDAFLAAARHGDFDALVSVLAPDVVLRADAGVTKASRLVKGSVPVARGASSYRARPHQEFRSILVNGRAGMAVVQRGKVLSIAEFTVRGGLIAEVNLILDPKRLSAFDFSFLAEAPPADQ